MGGAKHRKTCRHNRAWPTIFNGQQGYLWCSDCGAIRLLRTTAKYGDLRSGTSNHTGGFVYAQDRWLYPRGHEDVLKQMERIKSS